MSDFIKEIVKLAKEYRAPEQDARFSNTYIAKDEHSGGSYKKFKQRIFKQCSPKVRQELGKYGITEGTGVNLEIHHLACSSQLHYIQRGHKSSYYTKLIKVLDGKIPYTYVKGERVSKKKLKEQLEHIVFIPKWFHELCKTGELSKISTIEQIYDKLKEKIMFDDTKEKVKGLSFDKTSIQSAVKSIFSISTLASNIDTDAAKDLLENAYNFLKKSIINDINNVQNK